METEQIRKETIEFYKYREETNDPSEIARTKTLGPLTPDGSGQRVPHTGAIIDGVEYTLIGFGKLDKRPAAVIPAKVDADIRKFMGKAYIFNFGNDLKFAVAKKLKDHKWPELHARLKRLKNDGAGAVGAMQEVFMAGETAEPEPETAPLPRQSKSEIESVGGVEAYGD